MELPVNLVLVILSLLVAVGDGRAPVLHKVGDGRFGWNIYSNFSEWASHERFYVGDWLYFGFDKRKLSVLEVNKTGYENCIETNFITNITRGGRDVFNLTAARSYYFISGRGYCFRGVKLAINVYNPRPSSPETPATPITPISHATTSTSVLSLFIATVTLACLLGSSICFHFMA